MPVREVVDLEDHQAPGVVAAVAVDLLEAVHLEEAPEALSLPVGRRAVPVERPARLEARAAAAVVEVAAAGVVTGAEMAVEAITAVAATMVVAAERAVPRVDRERVDQVPADQVLPGARLAPVDQGPVPVGRLVGAAA
jgi:hypothetical protein